MQKRTPCDPEGSSPGQTFRPIQSRFDAAARVCSHPSATSKHPDITPSSAARALLCISASQPRTHRATGVRAHSRSRHHPRSGRAFPPHQRQQRRPGHSGTPISAAPPRHLRICASMQPGVRVRVARWDTGGPGSSVPAASRGSPSPPNPRCATSRRTRSASARAKHIGRADGNWKSKSSRAQALYCCVLRARAGSTA